MEFKSPLRGVKSNDGSNASIRQVTWFDRRSGHDRLPGFGRVPARRITLSSGFCVAFFVLTGFAPLDADTIVLRSGGRIEGEVIREEEREGRQVAVIQAASGVEIVLPKSSIEGVKTAPPALAEYEDLKSESGDTVEDHLILADFCRQNRGMTEQREYHLWQIIRLDPDNEEARRGLKFTRLGGKWTTQDQYMRRQGYIRVGRTWGLPNEVVLNEMREEAEQRVIDWRRKLDAWSTNLKRSRNLDATLAGIRAINDPAAIVPLAELLRDSESREAKELWLNTLIQIDHPAILGPLREMSLLADDDRIREKCLKTVVEHPDPATLIFYQSHLDPDKNSGAVINRAGYALEAIGSEKSIRFLIEALVSPRKITLSEGSAGRTGAAFNSNGGGGLTVGEKPRVETVYETHDGVLAALRTITNQNYRFDKDSWKQWYVDHVTPRGIDLRRSDD